MKNVMIIISSLAGGGAQRVTVNLANALRERYDVCVVTLFSNPDDYRPDEKVKVIRYADLLKKTNGLFRLMRRGFFPRLIWVCRLKKKYRPAATISMLRVPNLINALTDCGDFRIVSERSDPSVIGGAYMIFTRLAAQFADHAVFQSGRVQRMFPAGVRKKSSIILNPVIVTATAAETKEKRIVTAGRLTDQKNHRMLIRAFSRFQGSHSDYILEIYGKGPLRSELEKLAEECGVGDSVIIRGFAPDLHEHISSAAMFVLSSDYEGMSNALLEAMMIGLPCISTDCAGSDEIIKDMENGLLVPAGDEVALAEAISRLADDEELRNRLAGNGRRTSERFRTDTVISQWIELIENNTSGNI